MAIAKFLLSKGARVEVHDTWYGKTPFMVAPFEIKRFLVAYGADIHARDKTGKTTIDYLVLYWNGKKDDVKNFILKIEQLQKENPKYLKQQQKFFMAVTSGDIKTVNQMLKSGFTPEDIFYEKSNTPLHWAADWGQEAMVVEFLNKGEQVNTKNSQGYTPLHYAALNNDLSMIDLLLANKADINIQDNDGRAPLHVAAWSGNLEAVQKLVENNADLNIRDRQDCRPLNCSYRSSNKKIIEYLKEAEKKANSK